MMTRLRGGTGELGIEMGRWHGVRREDRVTGGRRCEYMSEERVRMERLMIDKVEGCNELGDKEKVVRVNGQSV